MERNTIKEQIYTIVSKYLPDMEIADNSPLTLAPFNIDSRGLAVIFIDIERVFKVSLDRVFEQALDYSIDSISKAVWRSR